MFKSGLSTLFVILALSLVANFAFAAPVDTTSTVPGSHHVRVKFANGEEATCVTDQREKSELVSEAYISSGLASCKNHFCEMSNLVSTDQAKNKAKQGCEKHGGAQFLSS